MAETVGTAAPTPPLTHMVKRGGITANFQSSCVLLIHAYAKLHFSGDVANEKQLPANLVSEAGKSVRNTHCTLAGVGSFCLPNMCSEHYLSGEKWYELRS